LGPWWAEKGIKANGMGRTLAYLEKALESASLKEENTDGTRGKKKGTCEGEERKVMTIDQEKGGCLDRRRERKDDAVRASDKEKGGGQRISVLGRRKIPGRQKKKDAAVCSIVRRR